MVAYINHTIRGCLSHASFVWWLNWLIWLIMLNLQAQCDCLHLLFNLPLGIKIAAKEMCTTRGGTAEEVAAKVFCKSGV